MDAPGSRWRSLRALDASTAVEILVLLAILVALGFALVPCRATAFWVHGEFTGWVVPIGNRMAEGQVLYADGGHMPLPPLAFVLSALLLGSEGRWIHESLLNHVLQSLTLLVLYAGLARGLPRPVPFLTVLGSFALFFSLTKSILYDPAVQLLVALLAVLTIAQTEPGRGDVPGRRRLRLGGLAGLAGVTAAALLSKQNTGLGALAGCACALALFPRSAGTGERLARAALYCGLSGLALLAGCLLLLPYIDVRGFFVDVFLTGSEPKGGSALALTNLRGYAREIVELATPARLGAVALLVIAGILGARGGGSRASANQRPILAAYVVALAAAGAGFAASSSWIPGLPSSQGFVAYYHLFTPIAHLGWLPKYVMSTGLILLLVIPALCLRQRLARRELTLLAALALVTLPAAVMHSLSVSSFRWTYDNNPLIVPAIGALCLFGFWTTQRLPVRLHAPAIALIAAAALLQFTLWSTSAHLIRRLEQCTRSWPEVRHLAGARLPPAADFLRELVAVVRRVAPAPEDEVLFLPNDPDVEAWFDRARPKLSGAIVFVDQYWDRYVDGDFERLALDPPEVIVIAPRNWGPFMQTFWGAGDRGARRLTMRVIFELLPQRYDLHASIGVPTLRPVVDDYMDIWVRKPAPPSSTPPAAP
jgi:hypothetical protein